MTSNTDNHTLNRRICADFCFWLQQGGYSPSARRLYSAAARFALGCLDPSSEQIQPEHIAKVRDHLAGCTLAPSTRAGYRKGLNKFWEFLRFPKPDEDVNWASCLKDIPPDLADSLRRYVTQRAIVAKRRSSQANPQPALTTLRFFPRRAFDLRTRHHSKNLVRLCRNTAEREHPTFQPQHHPADRALISALPSTRRTNYLRTHVGSPPVEDRSSPAA